MHKDKRHGKVFKADRSFSFICKLLLCIFFSGSLAHADRKIVTLPGAVVGSPIPHPTASVDLEDLDLKNLEEQQKKVHEAVESINKIRKAFPIERVQEKIEHIKINGVVANSVQKILDFKNMRTVLLVEAIFSFFYIFFKNSTVAGARSWFARFGLSFVFFLSYLFCALILIPWVFWGQAYLALIEEIIQILWRG